MAGLLATGLTVVLGLTSAIASAQQTSPNATGLQKAHPFCRPKASTPEILGPDPRFDVVPGAKPADTPAVLSHSPNVKYPRAAMDSGICGTVVLQAIVKTDGKVSGVRVIESLDKLHGLDADAMKAVSGWRFKPARLNGKAATTLVTARVEYVLDAIAIDPFEASDNVGRFAEVCGYLRPAPDSEPDGMVHFQFSITKKSLMVRIPETATSVLAGIANSKSAAWVVGPIVKAQGRTQITVTESDRIAIDPSIGDVSNCKDDPHVVRPTIRAQYDPKYTPQAMRHKVIGQVELDAVVLPNGRVGFVKVVQSLDRLHGLDDEAIATAYRWRFKPATKDGRPVTCRIGIMMEFRLH